MKRLSIKTKIMLWFTAALIVLVIGTSSINFSVSRQVLDESIQERLVNIVSDNAEEIEYYNSVDSRKEARDFFLSYKGGILEIDDDFCDYYEGICTALVDSDNNLLYGEAPIRLSDDEVFTFTSVGTVTYEGEKFYVYEKKLSGDNLDGLWLRGFVSENESTHFLYKMVRMSTWLMPMLAAVALLGGYVITRRSFLPIETINAAANEISESGDLSKRIDLGEGKDEIHNLADTFNKMFTRLESAFNAEKQFTSDASHELRTPISIIKAHCEYAMEFAETEEDYMEALEAISRQSDAIESLLSQLLFFARLEQGNQRINFTDTDLSRLVQSLCDDRVILFEGKRSLETDISPNVHAVIDENLIVRLLNNLIDNAVKYSDPSTPIEISLSEGEHSIALSVKDYGIGIASENTGKIWNRFYQEDPSRNKTSENSFGLGLSMVKEIADIHGGTMEVESQLGLGSRFTLILPKI